MSDEDRFRHPGGRTCAGIMAMIVGMLAAGAGLVSGVFWAALH